MRCASCKGDLDAKDKWPGDLCRECFFSLQSQVRDYTEEEYKRLRNAVQAETSGLLPQQTLLDIIERGFDRLTQGQGTFDREVGAIANEVQRLAGLFMCRQMLEFLQGLEALCAEQEEEIRAKVRRLSSLG